MRRRRLVLLILSLGLAACGDDSPPAAGTLPVSIPASLPTLPPVMTSPTTVYDHATGPEDVVVEVAEEGGFVPVEMLFARTPILMVTGDGRALSTGPVPEIFPGPLLPNVLQRTITREATQRLLALADDLGLLADVAYARNDMIADAPDTVVTIVVGGTTYRHRAYALGIGDDDDPARARLAEFVASASDLPATVGHDELGPEEPFVADEYLIRSMPVDPATLSVDIEPTIVEWPADAPVRLADAADCASLPAALGNTLFADARALTFYTDAGVTYAVTPVPRLPGRSC